MNTVRNNNMIFVTYSEPAIITVGLADTNWLARDNALARPAPKHCISLRSLGEAPEKTSYRCKWYVNVRCSSQKHHFLTARPPPYLCLKRCFRSTKKHTIFGENDPKKPKNRLGKFWLYTYRRKNYSRSRILAYFCHNRVKIGQKRRFIGIPWKLIISKT